MRRFVTFIYLFWSCTLAIGAVDTHYVSLDGTNDSGNGYITWSGAATQIQYAVDASTANDTVIVSNGTYTLTNSITITKAITLRSFTEQGHGTNDTIVNGNYPEYTNRCVYMTAAGTVSGFTVSNGFCGPTNGFGGGGVYLSSGTLTNCYILRNYSSNQIPSIYVGYGGAGVFIGGAAVVSSCAIVSNIAYKGTNTSQSGCGGGVANEGGTLVNSYIGGNIAYNQGGGVWEGNATCTISNCLIAGNWASVGAGGIRSQYTYVRNCIISNNVCTNSSGGISSIGRLIQDSIIVNNTCGGTGGGITAGYALRITNCLIQANIASNGGGGVYFSCREGTGVVANCTIVANLSVTAGPAGLYFYGLPTAGVVGYPQIRNCLIYGNTNLGGDKGGVYIESTSNYPNGLINCTIVSNQTATKGGGIYAAGANNYIENCIVYGNVTTNDAYDEIYNATAANTNNYWHTCSPTNLVLNQGNIVNDPLFVDRANNNYRLNANSPCINAGTNQSWMTNSVDLDGRTRIRYGTVDMGAYECIHSGTMYGFH